MVILRDGRSPYGVVLSERVDVPAHVPVSSDNFLSALSFLKKDEKTGRWYARILHLFWGDCLLARRFLTTFFRI